LSTKLQTLGFLVVYYFKASGLSFTFQERFISKGKLKGTQILGEGGEDFYFSGPQKPVSAKLSSFYSCTPTSSLGGIHNK